jgi:hypothetical protein
MVNPEVSLVDKLAWFLTQTVKVGVPNPITFNAVPASRKTLRPLPKKSLPIKTVAPPQIQRGGPLSSSGEKGELFVDIVSAFAGIATLHCPERRSGSRKREASRK